MIPVTDNYLVETLKSRIEAARHNKLMQRAVLLKCPFSHYDFDAENWRAKSKSANECVLGEGMWCRNCSHYRRHLFQKGDTRKSYEQAKLRRLNSILKSDSVPWKRKSKNFESLICPQEKI